MAEATPTSEETDFMQVARDRHAAALANDQDDRAAAVDDVRFAAGDQWEQAVRDIRTASKRPVLTWNRLPVFIAQVVNDARENKPSVHVSTMDGGTKATAEFYQGRIRQIEYESDADIAYDTSADQQVTCGRGFYRVITKYRPGTFQQCACIEPIPNQFAVLFDPGANKYDRTDADYCFVTTLMSRDAYKRKYGDSEVAKNSFYVDAENPVPDWVGVGATGDLVQVAEYWVKEYRKRKVYKLADGSEATEDNYQQLASQNLALGQPEPQIVETRTEDAHVVMQYVINGVEKLDETEWIDEEYIPVVPVWGREKVVEGRRRTFSLIRNAKDPQRLVNLYASNIAEMIGQMPKQPYIGPAGFMAGFENEWASINTSAKAAIQYSVIYGRNGEPLGPPQRQNFEPPIQALTIGLSQSIDAVKAAMGMFDAAIGARSNETSGLAIDARRKESDSTNFDFHDNEARSRKHLGRILVNVINKIDNVPGKRVPVRDVNGKMKLVTINEPFTDEETGEETIIDLNNGEYDVAVSTGPSQTSQREQAFDIYSQVITARPELMDVMGDLMFRNMDAPGSDEIANRLEKLLPLAIQPQKGNQPPVPPQVQQAMQMLMQQHEQLTNISNKQAEEIRTKKIELDSKERIEMAKLDVERQKIQQDAAANMAKLGVQAGIEQLRQEIDTLKHQQGLYETALARQQTQQHEKDMAEQAQQAAQQMAQQQPEPAGAQA